MRMHAMAADVDERARRGKPPAVLARTDLLIQHTKCEKTGQHSEHDHTSIVVDLVRPRH